MKKLLLLLMALFMMVFCFAACGSDDEDADVDEESSVSDEVDEDEDSEEDSEAEDSEAEDSEAEDEESGASSLYVGTWKLSYVIDPDGNQLTMEEYYTAIGQADAYSEEAVDVSYTFNDDGTGTADMSGISQELTWTVGEDNVITYTLTEAGTSSTLSFNGEDAMTYEDESSGYTSVYEKQ